MKTLFLPLLAAFALTAGTAAAQTTTPDAAANRSRPYATAKEGRSQGSPEEMARRQGERMTKELGLSADQIAKVQQMLLARTQQMQTMRSQPRDASNRDQMREQMQTSRAAYDAQFKAVLTAEQYAKYTTMQNNRMNRGGGRGPEGDKLKVKSAN